MEGTVNFLKLYEEIYRILPKGDIQELMDVCYSNIGVPIITVDILYNVLGIAPSTPTGDYMWDYLLTNRGYETEMVAKLYENGILQSPDELTPPYVVDWGTCKDAPKILGIIKFNNMIEGYVTMNCKIDEITPDRIKAMDIIMNLCTHFFKHTDSENRINQTYHNVFATELFNHRIHTEKQLKTWTNDMNCKLDAPFRVIAVTTMDKHKNNVLTYMRKSCQSLSPYQFMIIKNGILYLLQYNYDFFQHTEVNINHFENILIKFHAHAGVSNAFHNLLDLHTYQTQAEDALKFGEKFSCDHLHFYSAYYLPAILYPRLEQMTKVNYLSPYINKIVEYDRRNSTDFLSTLEAYIRHLYNTQDTANALHIHRNTLLYRINKIEELFHFSLKDFNTLTHLIISFYMLELEKKLQ